MRADAEASDALRALGNAVESTFDEARWRELGAITGAQALVERHPRLLRSLARGENDYYGCVLEVLPIILGAQEKRLRGRAHACFPLLREVEEFVGLEAWLERHDRELHRALYADVATPADKRARRGAADVETEAARIRRRLPDDPAAAVASALELLEIVLRDTLDLDGREAEIGLPALAERANLRFGMETGAAGEQGRRLLGALHAIVATTAELERGLALDAASARMAVAGALAAATFYASASP